jgi:hypothetical protein
VFGKAFDLTYKPGIVVEIKPIRFVSRNSYYILENPAKQSFIEINPQFQSGEYPSLFSIQMEVDMISNDSNLSPGCSGWLKGVLAAAVALLATGSSIVGILDYFNIEPASVMPAVFSGSHITTQEPVQPTALPGNTAEPTATSQPTATIPPTVTNTPQPPFVRKPDAVEFVLSYWQNVSDHKFETAWKQLSPGFQRAFHNNSYEDYLQGYQKMNICRIQVSNANLVQQDDFSTEVTAHFTYYTGTRCSSSEHDFEMWLVYDQETNSWLFDRNIRR